MSKVKKEPMDWEDWIADVSIQLTRAILTYEKSYKEARSDGDKILKGAA